MQSSFPTNSIKADTLHNIVKPVRPLTVYHLFFQLEREYLLQNIESPDGKQTVEADDRPLGIEVDPEMPARYKNIHVSVSWYASNSGKRVRTSAENRNHRKVHGKISFRELSHQVSTRWRTLEQTDNETKLYCAKIAKRELDLYKDKVKIYKANACAAGQQCRADKIAAQVPSHPTASGASIPSGNSFENNHLPLKKRKIHPNARQFNQEESNATCELGCIRSLPSDTRDSSSLVPPRQHPFDFAHTTRTIGRPEPSEFGIAGSMHSDIFRDSVMRDLASRQENNMGQSSAAAAMILLRINTETKTRDLDTESSTSKHKPK